MQEEGKKPVLKEYSPNNLVRLYNSVKTSYNKYKDLDYVTTIDSSKAAVKRIVKYLFVVDSLEYRSIKK